MNAKSRKRGRPEGSVTLTPEIQATVVSLIRGGVFAGVAAQTAGISDRTFRDWMARGEDNHPSRSSTPELRAFAEEVRMAQAEARAGAEARIYRDAPKYWLTHVARSTSDSPGWTQSSGEAVDGDELVQGIEQRLDELGERRAKRRSSTTPPPADDPAIAADGDRSDP
ncbi:MAG: hypothetical protein WD739_00335 [Actinomycetota bacterium]